MIFSRVLFNSAITTIEILELLHSPPTQSAMRSIGVFIFLCFICNIINVIAVQTPLPSSPIFNNVGQSLDTARHASSSIHDNLITDDDLYNDDKLLKTELEDASSAIRIKRTIKDLRDVSTRKGFIRKVYLIFCVQMSCTVATTAYIMNHPALASFLQKHYQTVALTNLIGGTAVVITLLNVPGLRFKKPYNFIMVGIHAMLQSFVVGTFSRLVHNKAYIFTL
jgi:hypothetical protein